MNTTILTKATNIVHTILSSKLNKGDVVIDATMGNGNDTLFLARHVGSSGKIFAFDVQEKALLNTTERLKANNIPLDNIVLINDSHEKIDEYINQQINCGIFNLGYLPRGDFSIVTKGEVTIKALSAILNKLVAGGIVALTVYYGHEGGLEEKELLLSFVGKLNSKEYSVLKCSNINQDNHPPVVIIIEKKF